MLIFDIQVTPMSSTETFVHCSLKLKFGNIEAKRFLKIFQKNDKKVIFWKLDIKSGVKSEFDHEYGFSVQNNSYLYVFREK